MIPGAGHFVIMSGRLTHPNFSKSLLLQCMNFRNVPVLPSIICPCQCWRLHLQRDSAGLWKEGGKNYIRNQPRSLRGKGHKAGGDPCDSRLVDSNVGRKFRLETVLPHVRTCRRPDRVNVAGTPHVRQLCA